MASIGLKRLKYGILNETNETYGSAGTIGKAIDCKVSLDLNSAELYADDSVAESDYSLKKGTITLTVDDSEDTVIAALTGHAIDSTSHVMTRKGSDIAPYVGLGRIITKVVGGVYKYKVEFLSKVKFKDSLPDEKTKGESVEFGTTQLEGTILKLSDGTWSKTKTFTTETEAITYLEGLFGS